ncbi:MAG: acetylserotonin O-methyltransferase [Acidobacteriota bacterium]|nr:acetylserotonin O-methyltransferase [Acidobacteriota bacterium]
MSSRTTETLVMPPVKVAPSPDEILIPLFTGMWAMQAVATAARLGIPDLLAAGPRTPEDVAAEAGTNPRATSRLLRALANLRLASPLAGGRYELTAAGERLRTGVPGTFKDAFIAETDEVHWQSWARAADAVRTGAPRPQAVFGMPAFDYYAKHREEGEQFGLAMENISRFAAHAVLEAYDLSGARTILDVGGGNGSMAIAILEKYREARGIVFDLPYIEGHAKERIRDLGVEGRCRFEPGDFFERVPKGADVHLMKFILHDWNDEESLRVLRNSRGAIEGGGRLVLIEMVVPEGDRSDMVHLMDLNMLVMTGGLERTAAEYGALLGQAGFRLERVIPTASPFSVVEARPV